MTLDNINGIEGEINISDFVDKNKYSLGSDIADLFVGIEMNSEEEIRLKLEYFIRILKALNRHIEDVYDRIRNVHKDEVSAAYEYLDIILGIRSKLYYITYRNLQNSMQSSEEIEDIAGNLIVDNYFTEVIFHSFIEYQGRFNDYESKAKAMFPSIRLFQRTRSRNRENLATFLAEMEMPLTEDKFKEVVGILTRNIFPVDYQLRLRLSYIEFGNRSSMKLEERELIEIIDMFNKLVTYPGGNDNKFYKILRDFFSKFVEYHPLHDWNGTLVLFLMRCVISKRKGSKSKYSYEYSSNIKLMLEDIFGSKFQLGMAAFRLIRDDRYLIEGIAKLIK